MIPEAREVHLSRKDRKVLEACCRSPVTLQRDLKRARIVLLAADGRSTRSIAKEVGVQPRIVSLWRHRYADHGLEGLQDKPRPGKQPIYTKTTDKRILRLLDKPPPQGFARWTGPLLAEALGDVDVQYVWRFLRSHKIDLVARKSWCESNDPNFTAKAADVVGLYVAPPAKAIVLCVDEKPSIQALERAQGYLKLPNGRALTGQSHDYKRHGTTTLFAALEVATGKIIATHSKRRRRVEFLDFMNSVTAAFPNRKLHVILDNLNTHKKNEDWLKAHPNVQFHFTPTSASWLNQVEVWFSILQGQSLSGTSFTSLKQLQEHIDAYVNAYNDRAEPFVWTKKHETRQIRLTRDHLRRRAPIRPFCFASHRLLTGPCETFAANTDAVAHRLPVVQNEIEECVLGIDDHSARCLVAGVVNHLPDKCAGTVSGFWRFDQRGRGRGRDRSRSWRRCMNRSCHVNRG
ncbi:transposase [Bradyrhizobium diazoefficiens]